MTRNKINYYLLSLKFITKLFIYFIYYKIRLLSFKNYHKLLLIITTGRTTLKKMTVTGMMTDDDADDNR